MSLLGLALPMLFVSGLLAGQATPAAAGPGIPPIVWELVGYTETNGQPTDIADPARYSLQFLPDGRLLARFDCNMGRGGFTAADGALTLTPIAATLMGCPPDSQADPFALVLSEVTAYRFDPDGHLLLRGEAGVLKLQAALTGVIWQWQGNVDNSGEVTVRPDHPENYTISFQPEGMLAIQADCNRGRGAYTVSGSRIDVEVGGVTKMMCPEGSLMTQFLGDLDAVVSQTVQGGNLALALPNGGGVMVFAPVVVAPEEGTPAAG